ncbi:translation initiation factor eIF-2B subunit epsilon [Trichonephila clavipes]|nr:translation initiation factor eIF-2B subunit epsilon [Trichonephila clavipes]
MASSAKIVRTSTKDDLQQQKITQAVIIGDNFNQRFAPLTNLKPLLLLPLANRPIIEYILEILEEADVQEVFIFCCSNNHVIRSYIKDSEWSKKEGMSVSVMSSASFLSMGDIMRELDSKALIKSDFILINGAILTTFDLCHILNEHRIRRQNDKNCAITLLYRKMTPQHPIRCSEQVLIVAVVSNSQRIRFYKRAYRTLAPQIPLEVFQENDEITVHYNLLDSYVSICSPCVPPLFSDNFDYQDMDDFVKGLIVNEEVNTFFFSL